MGDIEMHSTAEAAEEKREQIYDAAVLEFQERGFNDASMDRISVRAGASKRTVYKHFESKEKLFQELIRRHWSRFAENLDVNYEKGRCIREQLIHLGRTEGELLCSPEVMSVTRLVMSEILRRPDLAEENEQKTDYKTAFVNMLREATLDGQLDVQDPEAAAEDFIALIKAKAFWPVIFGGPVVSPDEMHKIVANSVEMMMSRYGA